MCGIYIHIPFCKSKCSYCDFYSVSNSSAINGFVDALVKEIAIRKNEIKGKLVETMYFGGGTPSILNISDINKILEIIYNNYNISKIAEITLEANPEDLTVNYLTELKKSKINRLSIGLQSTDDYFLKLMRRRHSAEVGINSVYIANKIGFENISVDLIYGLEGLSQNLLKTELDKVLQLPVKHISAYHLGIEEGTLLYRRLKEGRISIIDEKTSFDQYNLIVNMTGNAGFYQYEISNFGKQGFVSIHNSSYWIRKEYLGFGPSAHSFIDNTRTYNNSSVASYCEKSNNGKRHFESETLSKSDHINETIMLSLRTIAGLNMKELEKSFGDIQVNRIKSVLKKTNPRYYKIENDFLKLTTQGMFVSDTIISSLFV
ncbi:MAG: radical SAM family heme chaperone HemW [Bacteroidales bacterium]|nr:radical SAM family heme chaperone HemW [Bacteroidales bacterium]